MRDADVWDIWDRPRRVKTFYISVREHQDFYVDTAALRTTLSWLNADVEAAWDTLGDDFWPSRFDANRDNLATFLRYPHEQALTPRLVDPGQLFAPSTLLAPAT